MKYIRFIQIQDMTTTYGHSLFPDVLIQYQIDDKLPIHMVSDWAKIQQCVVNLVSNAQKHVHNFVQAQQQEQQQEQEHEQQQEQQQTQTQEINLQIIDCGHKINKHVVTVKFLLDETNNQLRIEVCDGCSVGVNNTAVSDYFQMEGTGLGSVALLVESMSGMCGGFRNSSSGRPDLGEHGSTFFIALQLQDNVALEVVLHDNDHIALVSSWKGRLSPEMQDSGSGNSACTMPSSPEDDVKEIKETKETDMTDATHSSSSNQQPKQHRLLLVEDVSINREFIKLWLQSSFPQRLDIVEASNGEEALIYFQEAIESQTPFDVVLMDIFMPIMNGYTCLEEMIKRYGNQRPPTIAISTSAPDDNHLFDDWVDKCDQNAMVKGMAKVINVEIK